MSTRKRTLQTPSAATRARVPHARFARAATRHVLNTRTTNDVILRTVVGRRIINPGRQLITFRQSEPRSLYQMKLIFLHGLPGVGKLTVASELSRLTGFKLFHNHLTVDLVGSLFEFGSEPFVELREKIWLATFSEAAAAKLDGLIFTFAFDRTVRGDFIEKTRSVVESGGGEVLFVELTCAPAELEKRIEDPSRRTYGKLSSVSFFRELKEDGAFVDPGIPAERLVLDTTDTPAPDAARFIVGKLGLELNA